MNVDDDLLYLFRQWLRDSSPREILVTGTLYIVVAVALALAIPAAGALYIKWWTWVVNQ